MILSNCVDFKFILLIFPFNLKHLNELKRQYSELCRIESSSMNRRSNTAASRISDNYGTCDTHRRDLPTQKNYVAFYREQCSEHETFAAAKRALARTSHALEVNIRFFFSNLKSLVQ